jgi:cytoskeletal protein RodZ
MFKVSTLLQNARLDRDLTILEVAAKLKVPGKYLQALDQGDSNHYPPEPYCSLYIKDYAEFLGLNGEEILALFRRDYYQKRTTKKIQPKNLLAFTPQAFFLSALAVSLIAFVFYLTSEYLRFNHPPRLEVNWPQAALTSDTFELQGETDPESTVRVNQDLIIVDPQGKFTKKISLSSPQTPVVVEAKSPAGKTTTITHTLSKP